MPRMRTLPTLALVTCLAVGAVACGGTSDDSADEEPTDDASGGDAAGGETATGEWTFTDDRGETVTLDAPPERIAAQSTIAGGLWEYGITVDGVFGPLRYADGTPDPSVGLADPDDFTSVGEVDSQINLEALAAVRPDVIVAPMWSEDTFWGIADDDVDAVEAIAPVIGILVGDRSMEEPLDRLGDLAATFGDDTAVAVDDARSEFDAAGAALSDALDAKPDLTVLATSGTLSELFVAWPGGFPDLAYYASLGMQIVEPTEHPEAGGYWQSLSWEQVDTYEADLILVDVRSGSLDTLLEQMPGSGQSLPAVQADQMVAWPLATALGYGNAAAVLSDLTETVESADESLV
jgi:iron complex transport system substrate-binding protein